MNKLGAKLLTATIKNPQKREFLYKFVTNNQFANYNLRRENIVKKQLNYVHNYLNRPNLIIIELQGGLGTQLYGYAFGKKLENMGFDVVFDASQYRTYIVGGGGNPKNKSKTPTNIRNLEITNFNLTLPIDLDFDKELFFDLVDKDRANLPPHERTKHKSKYLMTISSFQDTQLIESLLESHFNCKFDKFNINQIYPNTYFCGWCFSPIYFKDLDSTTLRREFTFKTPLSTANMNLKARILDTKDSVFLHIRRGDYLSIKECSNLYTKLCEGKYYEGAIRLIKSKLTKPHIFIFSNDMAWCEREFLGILSDECKESVEFEFVANNGEDSAVQEMELMRSCQNAITANSSFSWWASYLIDNPHKIVVMPNQFFVFSPKTPYDNALPLFKGAILVDLDTGKAV